MFNNDGQSQGGGSFGGDFEMSPNLYPYYKPMDEHKQVRGILISRNLSFFLK